MRALPCWALCVAAYRSSSLQLAVPWMPCTLHPVLGHCHCFLAERHRCPRVWCPGLLCADCLQALLYLRMGEMVISWCSGRVPRRPTYSQAPKRRHRCPALGRGARSGGGVRRAWRLQFLPRWLTAREKKNKVTCNGCGVESSGKATCAVGVCRVPGRLCLGKCSPPPLLQPTLAFTSRAGKRTDIA